MLCGSCDGLAKTPANGLLVGTILGLDRSRDKNRLHLLVSI